MCMAGGTTPQTLAGTLVVHNAEVLAGITMVQLAERGAPVIYSSSTHRHGPAPRHRLRRHARDGAAQRLRRADSRPVQHAVLGGRVVGGLQGERRADRVREDPHRTCASAGRGQPDLRCGDARVGHDMRSGSDGHGQRGDRAHPAVRARRAGERRDAGGRPDRRRSDRAASSSPPTTRCGTCARRASRGCGTATCAPPGRRPAPPTWRSARATRRGASWPSTSPSRCPTTCSARAAPHRGRGPTRPLALSDVAT